MKTAIVGSRSCHVTDEEIANVIPSNTTEIISGGAVGIDQCAAQYADDHGIKFTVFLPDYQVYGRAAPLKRNTQIIQYSDYIIIFWNGTSRGSKFMIDQCIKLNKPHLVVRMK